MRRFASDQMPFNFSPQGPSYYRPSVRVPYSHIQVVQKPEPARHIEHASQQVTFRKPSYSKEAEQLAAHHGSPTQNRQAPAPLPLKPTASLANMASGTTFAAKARAAELNAVRARRALQDTNKQDDPTMPTAMSGPVKLSKPRSRGRGGWKPLNLGEIPESTTEAAQSAYENLPWSTGMATASDGEEQPYQEASQYPRGQFMSDMVREHGYVDQERIRHLANQYNQMALQQQMPQYVNSSASAFASQYQAPLRRSPEQERNATEDDPFIDMPKSTHQLPVHAFLKEHQLATDVSGRSNATTPLIIGGAMDYNSRFPIELQEGRNMPHPPGLPVPSSYSAEAYLKQKPLTPSRQPAPTANTHQRDPKPYTSFTRNSDDSSQRDKLLQNLQQVADRSKVQGELASSTRTVLYDPVAQDVRASTTAHGPSVSQSGDDFLKTSEPLPWKDRPVDIYNMLPPTLAAPCLTGAERAVAAAAADHDVTVNLSSAEQRQKDTEAWWYHDGRGQEQRRAWLEQVVEEHRRKKTGQDYESMKKSLERQASFRDDWSDSSNITTLPDAAKCGDAFNQLIGPILTNLFSYRDDDGPAYFNKFTKAPAWAVDGSMDGNKSFFEKTWGKPPSRVGRDPRYRPTFHEGRYTVFEPTDGRTSMCWIMQAAARAVDLRVGNKYRIGRKIGSGSFGDIYLGTNIISGEEIAIKLESVKAKHPQLEYEARVYKSLAGGVGIPFVRWFGTECDYNAMVLDLLGPSLEDLFNFCNRKFSLKTVLLLADQLISRIEYIHAKSFIHRDIKPDNFLMGIGKRGNQVNVIDFGLAKKYRDPKTHFHIPYRENKNLTGTARYASINTHLGVEQSRRDDMESLGYVMLYFCRGSLPWQGLKAATKKQKYDRIMEKKMTTPTEVLCRGFPNEFAIYLNYTRSLRFDDKPDYSYLRKIFRDLFVREGFQYDYVFDWTVYKYQKNAQAIAAAGNTTQQATQDEEEKPARRHGGTGAISSQRRKIVERPAGGIDTPDTNRAVGGSDR
ncbi:MAG: hypothetical protein Q9209_006911, partial [Squamulea sp. 1 TL-2023]